jgi:hypothetical protein
MSDEKIIKINEYGVITNFPQEICAAQYKYFDVIKPYLDSLSIVEVRTMEHYCTMDFCFAEYILRRNFEKAKASEKPHSARII